MKYGVSLYLLTILFLQLTHQQFDVSLPVTTNGNNIQSKISLQKKQVYVDIDLTQTYLQICCKPNRDIFEIVHSFLSNPFFQINQYTCPQTTDGFKLSQITLPSLGYIQMNHSIVAYPKCTNKKGMLGLNKNSIFLNYLPINAQTIRISVNDLNDLSKNKVSMSFGGIQQKLDNAWIFPTKDQNNWDITAKSIQLGRLSVHQQAKIVFTSMGAPLKISNQYYSKISLYFASNQTCRFQGEKLLCLCQSGIPVSFPSFEIKLSDEHTLTISPQMYMSLDSNICTVQFEQSPNQNWYFNVIIFGNTVFHFNRNNASIIIQHKAAQKTSPSQTIHLPIQLILNVSVILLLCIFASLVIIQITKRITGLNDMREEDVRQYIIRNVVEDA